MKMRRTDKRWMVVTTKGREKRDKEEGGETCQTRTSTRCDRVTTGYSI